MSLSKNILSSTVCLALISTSSLLQAAAPPPNIGDAIQKVSPPQELRNPNAKPLVDIEGVKKIYRPELTEDKNQQKVLVDDFSLEGNDHISSETLLALIASNRHKMLSFNEIKLVASMITKEYREQGYIVARAYIPVQNMDNGILDIVIIEGRYGAFKLQNNTQVSTTLIHDILEVNQRGDVIQNRKLERSLLLVNDLPGVIVSAANISAGEEVGSSDFSITTDKSKPYNAYILLDNYGDRYTGKSRAMAGIDLYSPFNLGDQLSLFGLSTEGGDLLNGALSYASPLHRSGLRAKVAYSRTTYQLGEEFSALDARGQSDSYSVELTYPLIKQRAERLDLSFKVEKNDLTDDVRSTNLEIDKEILVYRVAASYEKTNLHLFNRDQQLSTHLILSVGDLNFDDEVQRAIDKASVDTEGHFSKIEFDVNAKTEVYKQLSLSTSFHYQHTLKGKNLDGSEDLFIGGPNGVKLFPGGELSAENGYIFNIETQYQLSNVAGLLHNIGVFYDFGTAYMENKAVTFERRNLQDIGLSYNANYKGLFAKVQTVWRVGSEQVSSEPKRDFRFLAMLGWRF